MRILSKMVRFFTTIYPKSPLRRQRVSLTRLRNSSDCFTIPTQCVPFLGHTRAYVDEGAPKPPGKEEKMETKMPGFSHPGSLNEEGYFTQKAKQQLEELKRKLEKPRVEDTERKD